MGFLYFQVMIFAKAIGSRGKKNFHSYHCRKSMTDNAARIFHLDVYPLLLMIITIALLSPQKALADGVVFGESFQPLWESEQRAAIAFHDNLQKMVLAINYRADEAEKSLWIFPVPAPADAVKIDLVDAFPVLSVFPIEYKAGRTALEYLLIVQATQIYIIAAAIFLPNFGDFSGVSRYEQVEKHGIQAEVVTVESQQALARYLKAQWPHVDRADLSVFQPYFSEQYALVIAHIKSATRLQLAFPSQIFDSNRHPCLYVEFPTDRIYYPLRPTAIYGDTLDLSLLRIQLYISGYVKPTSNHYSGMRLHYCYTQDTREDMWGYEEVGPIPDLFQDLVDDSGWLRFTKMEMTSRPNDLTEDLWFRPYHAKGLAYCETIIRLGRTFLGKLITVFTILLFSFIAGGISGFFLTGEFLIYGLIGLSNLLSLFVLYFVITVGKSKAVKQLKDHRKKFIFLFTLIYIGLTILLKAILMNRLVV